MKVLDIQRMSTEDGPGLRTTVFVKGCPLRCAWCHNPESIPPRSHVEWLGVRCIGCRICEQTCPQKGIRLDTDGVHTSEQCEACGACTAACPTQALELKGTDYTVDALFDTVMKDRSYWGKDGGVTLSGGEITLQWQEALTLLTKLKEAGVNTAVDTCGLAKREVFEALLPVTDIFLYDLKLFDDAQHRRFTGQGNARIISNFEWLTAACEGTDTRIWVRTPIIPGATDTDDNIRGIATLVQDKTEKWELCAFNNLCRDKYDRLGKDWDFKEAGLISKARMEALTALAVSCGAPQAVWSGATARTDSET
ncbi:MAG: glycyl-radical enzyme activating protein [Clostridia bacterium]|nr:glycyl-radical enzyme activating protein [Clostridia bacterium]